MRMYHPDRPDQISSVSEWSFKRVWQPKGYLRVEEEPPTPTSHVPGSSEPPDPNPLSVSALNTKTNDELKDMLREKNLKVSGNKATLINRLRADAGLESLDE